MAIFLAKNRADILRQALQKVQQNTSVTAIGAGSIARAFVEGITSEIADLYDILDFNMAQSVISSASGSSLDLLGQLYNVPRKSVGDLIQTDRSLGAFYFYLDTPYSSPITIPAGTRVFTANDNFVAQQLSYVTVDDVLIPQGRMKSYATIRPQFNNSIFTAGANTITQHDFISPVGGSVKCTNPKPIVAQPALEDDNNYRLRIVKNIRVTSAGTADAIRFAALGVGGVRDIKVYDSSLGLGTFQVVLIPENKDVNSVVADNVRSAIQKVRPIGVNYFIDQPNYIGVDIMAQIFLPSVSLETAELSRRRATVSIMRYLNTLLPGDTLVYNKMLQYVFDSSDQIKDIQINKFAPNGIDTIRKNFTPDKAQMIIPGNIQVTSV